MKISIIIPTLNEAGRLGETIESCWQNDADQIVVCDGGSIDDTVAIAESMDCQVVKTVRGRGNQLAAGVESATGAAFLFLHADTRLSGNCLDQIRAHLEASDDDDQWGCFEQSIDESGTRFRILERGNRMRVAWRGLVYGDQAMWVSRPLYERVGGFARIPLMEDVCLSSRLRKHQRPVILDGPVFIPARHWKKQGVVRTTLRNWYMLSLFRLGVRPERIAARYYR